MNTKTLPPLALIAGPTASGKSALALALAEATPSVIINADSMQVYRDLRVVTARPSEADEARAPHRLFGFIDGSEACSAARWAALARAEVDAVHAEGRLPVVVGGTGLYIRTLLDGIAPIPDIDPAIRAEVRALAVGEAHAALGQEDAKAAGRLAPGDTARVARALEVVRSTGHSIRYWQKRREGGIGDRVRITPLLLLPPREDLLARCDARFEVMLSDACPEIAALAARNLDPALPVMRAIGVVEIADLIAGRIDTATALAQGQLATRQYAKRQYTWFQRQSDQNWPRLTETLNSARVGHIVTKLLRSALTG